VLTTIRAPWAHVGSTAVALLNKLIEGESVPALTTLPVEFVLGATT
jgi:LacI family transcriptional regulator